MRRNAIFLAVCAAVLILPLMLFIGGCGASSESPSEVAEQAIRAIADKDCEKIVGLSASDRLNEDYGGDRDAALKDCREGMDAATNVEGVGAITFEVSNFEVVEEQIDGDTATVKYKAVIRTVAEGIDEEQTDEDQIELVKEGGNWKVAGLGL